MVEFEDNKYIVIKTQDFKNLSMTNRGALIGVLDKIQRDRLALGKDPEPKYYVCNQDEPYAIDVLNTILKGEERKERKRISDHATSR